MFLQMNSTDNFSVKVNPPYSFKYGLFSTDGSTQILSPLMWLETGTCHITTLIFPFGYVGMFVNVQRYQK